MSKRENPVSNDYLQRLLILKRFSVNMLKDQFEEAHNELTLNFEQYLTEGSQDTAQYEVMPFGGSIKQLKIRFDIQGQDAEDEFVHDAITEAANEELKQLHKYVPELFDNNFQYGFEWNEGRFCCYAYLDRDTYEAEYFKGNPEKPYNPKFLSWCKSYEQEVQEFEELIEGGPADVALLKKEYEQLTGKKYRRKKDESEEVKKPQKKKRHLRLVKVENPSWVADEKLWEEAKKKSLKEYGRISYPFVVFLYKQMGGKMKKRKVTSEK